MIVTVRSVSARRTRNRRTMVEAVVGDGTGRMHIVFFNQPWRERQLTPELDIALYGKLDVFRGGLQMTNPIVDLIGDRTGRIVPIYPQSDKAQINTWEIAGWVDDALHKCEPRGILDPVPAEVRGRLDLAGRAGGAGGDPPSRVDHRQEPGPAPPGVRRAAAGAAGAREAQARDRGERGRHQPRGRRRAGPALPRRAPVLAHERPAPGDRRDRRRPGVAPADAPPAPGRRRGRQDRRGAHRAAVGRAVAGARAR